MTTNRRQFLSRTASSAAVVSLGGAAPQFLVEAAASGVKRNRDNILVVVQLSGGNDGLNTIAPFKDERYRGGRPTLAIAQNDVLKINDELGFHPSARGLADLLEAGRLAIVQGVGYSNPNRSHFESMDIWHTCQRKKNRSGQGWLGRYLDTQELTSKKNSAKDVPGLHLGRRKQPLALAGERVRVPSVRSLDRFRLQGASKQVKLAIEQLAELGRPAENDLLGFVQSSTTSALSASQRVDAAKKQYDSKTDYPNSQLAQQLKIVAQLIDAGLQTRIYYVELDGFDTHSQQADAHAALLNQWGGAVHAFVEDIAQHGHGDRVAVMSFSEFGRRVQENASKGTDHGAAAPLFLAGAAVKPGLHGKHPDLGDLQQGDLKHHTDFRRVYATVLEKWLGHSTAQTILGAAYRPLDLFA